VFRRSLLVAALGACALALASPAAALRYHVRVEGKTQTIFGANEPRFSTTATQVTALDALEAASVAGEFFYRLQATSFGPFVDQVGRYPSAGTTGWVFKVNGVSPPVGADQVPLREGDRVVWYFAQFGAGGGPDTLHLRRDGTRCYVVTRRNDAGVERRAAGATLSVDGRRFRARTGRACLPRHTGWVRATLGGAIRSNAVR
jgi:hypothetical protein